MLADTDLATITSKVAKLTTDQAASDVAASTVATNETAVFAAHHGQVVAGQNYNAAITAYNAAVAAGDSTGAATAETAVSVAHQGQIDAGQAYLAAVTAYNTSVTAASAAAAVVSGDVSDLGVFVEGLATS